MSSRSAIPDPSAAFSSLLTLSLLAILLAALLSGCMDAATEPAPEPPEGMVLIPGGAFTMGSDSGFPAERPAHPVRVSPFFLAKHEVSVAEFAGFVEQTGYVTDAERIGWAAVFDVGAGGWKRVDGADWRQPLGPGSSAAQDHPVVQVSYNDALAYAVWAGGRLATEAEREYAARGGLENAPYPWGDELMPQGAPRSNIWQGQFPARNTGQDGYVMTAPVGSFPPNGYGLHDMAGNVWEWTADWLGPYPQISEPRIDPQGPEQGTERVIRGGSWMCSSSYCAGYRVTARQGNEPDAALNNLGFRIARDFPAMAGKRHDQRIAKQTRVGQQ
jgi:formylglycine-generating enzyme